VTMNIGSVHSISRIPLPVTSFKFIGLLIVFIKES
jgi:hypothetical protein